MPAPPYSAGTATPSRPEPRHAAQHAFAIEPVLAIVFPDVRRDLARRPLADRLLEQTLFVCEGEVDHERRVMLSRGPDDVHRRAALADRAARRHCRR